MTDDKRPEKKSSSDKLGTVHHYVPQSYLKRFAISDKPEQVIAYEVGKRPYATHVHNVAGQRDFYTYTKTDNGKKDADLEDILAGVDDAGINVLRMLDDMPDGYVGLPEEYNANLLAYIAFQHTRNLQERKMWATMFGQSTKMYMQAVASQKDSYHRDAKKALGHKYKFDTVERTRKAFLNGKANISYDPLDQYFIGTALEMSKVLYEILFTSKKMVLVSKTNDASEFVTSDNPVTHYLTEEQKTKRPAFLGVGYIDAVFQLPISSGRCILLINKDMVMEMFQYDQDAVNYINFHTYYFADRWLFSCTLSDKTQEEFEKYKHVGPFSSISSPFARMKKKSSQSEQDLRIN